MIVSHGTGLIKSPPFNAGDKGVAGGITNIGKSGDILVELAVVDDPFFFWGEGAASCDEVHQMYVKVALGGWNVCIVQLEVTVDST
jgi:hypothetical protein